MALRPITLIEAYTNEKSFINTTYSPNLTLLAFSSNKKHVYIHYIYKKGYAPSDAQ